MMNDISKEVGFIGYEGKNDKGQDMYSVNWDPSITTELGTSGIFEESYHLKETIEGKEMQFEQNTSGTYGVKNLDIYDEVRAKQWVVNNIDDVKSTYSIGNDYYKMTHYGQVMTYKNAEDMAYDLMKGKSLMPPISRDYNSINKFGTNNNMMYVPMGFTGKGYHNFSPIKLP